MKNLKIVLENEPEESKIVISISRSDDGDIEINANDSTLIAWINKDNEFFVAHHRLNELGIKDYSSQ